MSAVLLVLVLLIWPVLEVVVAIKVGELIGVLPTLALLIASWPAGTWALRSQGRVAWRRFSAAVAGGRPPGAEAVDGTLVLLGGGLLIVPGFLTDAAGIVLLLPPTRVLLRRLVIRNFRNSVLAQAVRVTRRTEPYDVDSTAHDVEPPRLPR